MCKYKISLTTSIVMLLLLVFSFGYTYAYFSQKASATASLKMYSIQAGWYNSSTFSPIGNGNSIAIKSNLKRGAYTQIVNSKDNGAIVLAVNYAEDVGGLSAYCRIKLEASYTNSLNQVKDCSQYVVLAKKSGSSYTQLTNSSTWKYDNGYYYYKNSSGLIALSGGDTIDVADYIFLSGNINADVFGAPVSITLTVEMAQVDNDGYKSVWGI